MRSLISCSCAPLSPLPFPRTPHSPSSGSRYSYVAFPSWLFFYDSPNPQQIAMRELELWRDKVRVYFSCVSATFFLFYAFYLLFFFFLFWIILTGLLFFFLWVCADTIAHTGSHPEFGRNFSRLSPEFRCQNYSDLF